METSIQAVIRFYRYDPLDRLAGITAENRMVMQCFYLKNRRVTETLGTVHYQSLQVSGNLLAQRQSGALIATRLLATDSQHSVLQALEQTGVGRQAYTAFGYHRLSSGLEALSGFNGEQPEPVTGHYLLGNGYRMFNPVLMRFNSPDSLSPFGKGGLNAYAYCQGNPVNAQDPTGHIVGPGYRPVRPVSPIASVAPARAASPSRRATASTAHGSNQASHVHGTGASDTLQPPESTRRSSVDTSQSHSADFLWDESEVVVVPTRSGLDFEYYQPGEVARMTPERYEYVRRSNMIAFAAHVDELTRIDVETRPIIETLRNIHREARLIREGRSQAQVNGSGR